MPADKTKMRKNGAVIQFQYVNHVSDCWVLIEPRTGDRWRYTINDNDQLSENYVHVADLHADTTHPLELLRLALNDYRAHRGEVTAS